MQSANHERRVTLTEGQVDKLLNAYKKGIPSTIRLGHEALMGRALPKKKTPIPNKQSKSKTPTSKQPKSKVMTILFDRGDAVKVNDAVRKQTGVVLNFAWISPKEIEKKQGGSGFFIPIAAAAGSEVAKKGGQWVGKKIFGGAIAKEKVYPDVHWGGVDYNELSPDVFSGGSAVLQGAPNVRHRRKKKLDSLPAANNHQLDRMILSWMKTNNFDSRLYRGAQPDDRLSMKGLVLPAIGIVNNEGSGEDGSHWTSYYISHSRILTFDPLGYPPDEKLASYIEMIYQPDNMVSEHNPLPIQDDKSIYCGYFAALFIMDALSKGDRFDYSKWLSGWELDRTSLWRNDNEVIKRLESMLRFIK